LALVGLFVIGSLLIVLAHREVFDINEIIRDLGIACIVSVVVAALIELSLARHTFLAGLDAIMKRIVPDDVWQDFRQHVISQPLTVEKWALKMNFRSNASGQLESRATLSYQITALERVSTQIVHELDRHRTATGTATGFTRARINDKDYPTLAALQGAGLVRTDARKLEFPAKLQMMGASMAVELEFTEIVGRPDTIVWWMPHVTRDVDVKIDGLPSNWAAEVETYHPAPHQLVPNGSSAWQFTGIMMPGQGIEIRIVPAAHK